MLSWVNALLPSCADRMIVAYGRKNLQDIFQTLARLKVHVVRSEERRVGKERRFRGSGYHMYDNSSILPIFCISILILINITNTALNLLILSAVSAYGH